jgi:hypothetical protein
LKLKLKVKMKLYTYITLALLAGAARPVDAAPAGAAAAGNTNVPVQSVFNLPSSPSDGRDPFFPNSMRPYEQAMVKSHHTDITSLKIRGFSEIAGRRYVIINNHTFSEGDEGDVMTPDGRIHLHCLAVSSDSVLVEASGVRHMLKFSDQ